MATYLLIFSSTALPILHLQFADRLLWWSWLGQELPWSVLISCTSGTLAPTLVFYFFGFITSAMRDFRSPTVAGPAGVRMTLSDSSGSSAQS
jgi:hypothetical protein